MRTIEEVPADWTVPALCHPEWRERLPWLVQGITGRGGEEAEFDLAFFGARGGGEAVWDRWSRLSDASGCARIVHGAQLHGTAVRVHEAGPPGVHLSWEVDAHATRAPGVLLAVSVADCVPVHLVHAGGRGVALIHAGWRGTAAGILGRALETLRVRLDVAAEELEMHAGPAICGECYEVGPEVHEALGLDRPARPTPVDLRRVLVEEAMERGVREDRITVSGHCTRCGPASLFSHRGGDGARQVAFLGIAGRVRA